MITNNKIQCLFNEIMQLVKSNKNVVVLLDTIFKDIEDVEVKDVFNNFEIYLDEYIDYPNKLLKLIRNEENNSFYYITLKNKNFIKFGSKSDKLNLVRGCKNFKIIEFDLNKIL